VTELDRIADELYALTPKEFTAARNAKAKGLPAAKTLKKPSAAAWALNQFARRRGDQLHEVFRLGEQLRYAQAELNSAALRVLASERRELVSAVAKQVARLASELGDSISASVVLEVEQSLQAAMADPRAADALRTGRLVRSLSTAGLDEVDLEGAVAGSVARTKARAKKGPTAAEVKKRQKQRADAEAAVRDADAAKTAANDRADEAAQLTTDLEEQLADLTARLADAREQLAASRAAQREAAHAADTAAERLGDLPG